MKHFIYRTLMIFLVLCCVCSAAPEPAIVPALGQWTLDVEFTHLQQIVLPIGENMQPKRFWYTIVTVTNNTGFDVDFYPKFDLMTDTFHITSAGTNVGSIVFDKIKIRHRSRYPFLENLKEAGNIMLQGEENAKDIAVIWPDFDPQARSIKIFMTGFSNETVAVNYPVLKDGEKVPDKVYLRKTLEISYDLEGESASRTNTNLIYKGKRWIMR
jgi:hypothetical protein